MLGQLCNETQLRKDETMHIHYNGPILQVMCEGPIQWEYAICTKDQSYGDIMHVTKKLMYVLMYMKDQLYGNSTCIVVKRNRIRATIHSVSLHQISGLCKHAQQQLNGMHCACHNV